jgi:hypothetical protein
MPPGHIIPPLVSSPVVSLLEAGCPRPALILDRVKAQVELQTLWGALIHDWAKTKVEPADLVGYLDS